MSRNYYSIAPLGSSHTGQTGTIGFRLVGTTNQAFSVTNIVETTIAGDYHYVSGSTFGIPMPNSFVGRIVWGTSSTDVYEEAVDMTMKASANATGEVTVGAFDSTLLDAQNLLKVDMEDLLGSPAASATSIGANILSVNGTTFTGTNVPAKVNSYATGLDPATYILVTPANKLATTAAGAVTTGGYSSGQDPATLVLDVAASSHNTTNSIGWKIGLNVPLYLAATVNDTLPTTTSFKASLPLTLGNTSFVNSRIVFLYPSALQGIEETISGDTVSGSTRQLTVATALPTVPANGDPFVIIGGTR